MTSCPAGLIAEVVSPADDNLEFDREGFAGVFERAAKESAAVFVNSVSAGEAVRLPEDVRNEIVSLSMELLKGRKTLLAGVAGNSCGEIARGIEFIKAEMKKRNYPGGVFIVDAPLCRRGNRGLSDYYRKLSEIAGLPFILLNDPVSAAASRSHFRRRNIRTNVLKKISMNPAVAGIAHNGGMSRSLNYIKAVRHRRDFCFYDANELNFLNSPGSGGVVSIGANVFPRAWRQVVDSSGGADEKMKRNESYRLGLLEKREKLKAFHLACRAAPAALVKAVLKDMGLISSDRVFGPPADEKEKEKILLLSRELLSGKED
jgi:dihydrodipicolinate synthase/N-acetylneuraminate lyase